MGNVPFTFKHALSQVVFKGRIGTSGAVTKVTIAEISLVNINKTGTITYQLNTTNMAALIKGICPDYANNETGLWYDQLKENNYAQIPDSGPCT